jgi:hypothetical protein
MERRRKPLREPRCGLCLTCANASGEASGEAWVECVAGADPRRALYDCDSYVRVFHRAPDVPTRYRHAL